VATSEVRAFIALELAEDVRRRIGDLVSSLRARVPEVRWVKPEGIHLTLRFLGDATHEQVERVGKALERAAAACPASDAAIRGLGVFPDRGQPRVLWLGLAAAPAVVALQAACEEAAVESGFAAEPRAFRPHLTLGRWRGRARPPDLPAADLGTTLLDTVTLFRSDLGPGGATHTPLRRLSLGPGP
jgi:2'-5' RNA ligase